MFFYDHKGIKLNSQEFWLDAHHKTPFSFVSHGHADHLKNHNKILATPSTVQFHAIRAKQKEAIPLNFGEPFELDHARITLYPAGHVLGSAMALVETEHGSLLYTGDFKVKKSFTAEEIETPKADVLIMESTFGNPEYQLPTSEQMVQELTDFIDDCLQKNIAPIVMGYSLGKAQEAMKIIGDAGYDTRVHRSAWELAKVYRQFGVEFKNCSPWKDEYLPPGQVLIIPPHLFRFNKIKNLPAKRRTVLLSGWNNSEIGMRFRSDHYISMSDHADSTNRHVVFGK